MGRRKRHKAPTRISARMGKLKITTTGYDVLIVDDMKMMHEIAVTLLDHYPGKIAYRLHHAHNARQAFRIFDNVTPDIVFTDWQMPGGNGDAVLTYVRGWGCPCYTILKSAFDFYDVGTLADYIFKFDDLSRNWFSVLDTLPIADTLDQQKKELST